MPSELNCPPVMLPYGWFINNNSLFLTVIEAGKFKIKLPVDLVFSESRLLDSYTAVFSLRPYLAERATYFSGVSIIRALIPFLEDEPS